VDEAAHDLEAAIADTGALLVRVQKYRRGAGPEGAVLAREALALGDAARRLHHRDALDQAGAAELLGRVRALTERLRALAAAARAAPEYLEAVAAERAGDRAALERTLPAIFAGLVPAAPHDLFAPLAWLRRGRFRPVAEVVAEIERLRDEGLGADGDDLSPGSDPELPAVGLLPAPPPDEPIVLRFPLATLGAPVHRLVETDDHLVHVARLRAPFLVRIVAAFESPEQLRVEPDADAWARWRTALADALGACGVAVETASEPVPSLRP